MHNPDHPHYGDTPKAENAIEEANRILAKMAGAEPSRGAPDADAERFEQWKQRYAPNDSGEDYDLLAAFRAGVVPDASGHWPDLFKKPNHPTFSVESIYAKGVDAVKAGRWEGDEFIPADAITKLRAARTLWHERNGVPIFQEYANFLTAIGECEDLLSELRPVKRATGRTIPDLTKREHVCEYQQSVKPRRARHVVLLEALRACVEWEADYRARNHLGRNAPHPFKQAEAAIQQAEGL